MSRILLLCEYSTLNGGERSLLALLPTLQRHGCEFLAVAPLDGELASALAKLQVPLVADLTWNSKPGALQDRRNHLGNVIERVDVGLIHANSLAMGRLVGPVSIAKRIASVAHLRDIVRLSATAVTDLNCNQRLIAVSAATRRWHLAQGVKQEKIDVIYNGMDTDEYLPRVPTGYLHRELGLPHGSVLVGAIGQIGMRKGLDVLLEAAVDIFQQRHDVHFLIVGQRYSGKQEAIQYETELHRRADEPALNGRIHFLGSRADVPLLLAELTLLVHSARQEPLGRVLLEAAAAGVPVIASDVGGTREIFPSHEAILIPSGNVQALAAAVVKNLDSVDDSRHLQAIAARRRVQNVFGVKKAAMALLDVYREVEGAR